MRRARVLERVAVGIAAALVAAVGFAIDSTGTHPQAATPAAAYGTNPDCATATKLCLNNSRFEVTADFQLTPEGPSSPATAVSLTNDTGEFWFFDAANVELIVKVLDGCSINDGYWVFAGGLTDVGVRVTVTDSLTGAVKAYSNAVGTAFQPILDSSAFPCP